MNADKAPETLRTDFPRLSHAEVARIIRQAELMRAEHLAGLLRSAGRGIARLARATVGSRPPEGRPRHGPAPATLHPNAAARDPFRPQPRYS